MEGKYSLIFMADNGKTARLRLGPALLRSLVALLALLPIVAGVSLWLNWKLYEDRRSVLSENAVLRATVDSNAQTVARLSGLEQFLQQAAPEALGELVSVSDVPPAPDMETGTEGAAAADVSAAKLPGEQSGVEASKLATPPASPEDSGDVAGQSAPETRTLAGESITATAGNAASAGASALGANASAVDDQSPDARATPALITEASPAITPEAGAGIIPEFSAGLAPEVSVDKGDNVDNGFARVENLVARRVGSRSLRISFDLFNAGQVPQIGGHTAFELISKEGQSVALPAHGDTTYRINRLKKIVGNPTLPAEITDTTGASVRVSIFADKELIYRITTPLQ